MLAWGLHPWLKNCDLFLIFIPAVLFNRNSFLIFIPAVLFAAGFGDFGQVAGTMLPSHPSRRPFASQWLG